MIKDEIDVFIFFGIIKNDQRKQFEFTPLLDGHTSYTVAFYECKENLLLACKSVYLSIKQLA